MHYYTENFNPIIIILLYDWLILANNITCLLKLWIENYSIYYSPLLNESNNLNNYKIIYQINYNQKTNLNG